MTKNRSLKRVPSHKTKSKSKSKSKKPNNQPNKSFKKNRKNTKNKITRRIVSGGGENEIRDDFRIMFIYALNNIKKAIDKNDTNAFNKAVDELVASFKKNQAGINSLILITNNNIPINKKNYNLDTNPVVGIVPLLSVLFHHVQDIDARKKIINAFTRNKGNINLQSVKGNITALSTAIELKDPVLVQYLVTMKQADPNSLSEENKREMDILLATLNPEPAQNVETAPEPLEPAQNVETEPVQTVETVAPEIAQPTIKLVLPSELPPPLIGYDMNEQPLFWKPLFNKSENEMFELREKILSMVKQDKTIGFSNSVLTNMWSICKIVQTMIPNYHVPTSNTPYTLSGAMYSDLPADFSNYNIILCAALLVYGIISDKMKGQDFDLIFKGGKAVQLVLSQIPNMDQYISEDIDILVMPKNDIEYNRDIIKNLSSHIGYLIKWFLNLSEPKVNLSVLLPPDIAENQRGNPNIVKLSYVKIVKRFNRIKKMMDDDYKAFSDLDFKELPENIKPYFKITRPYPFYVEELNQNLLFICPNIGAMIDEKIYYYAKYTKFLGILKENKPITEEVGYERLNIAECERMLDKFKRSIVALTKGLEKSRNPDLNEEEVLNKQKKYINNKLIKFGYDNDLIQQINTNLLTVP